MLVLLSLLLQYGASLVTLCTFELNHKTIAAKLCERRTAHCNGHCFLQKQLDREAKQDRAATQRQQQLPTVPDEHRELLAQRPFVLQAAPSLLADVLSISRTPPVPPPKPSVV